ncbi:hypothetical protein GCM10020227_11410 [Streptomyces flavovirens]
MSPRPDAQAWPSIRGTVPAGPLSVPEQGAVLLSGAMRGSAFGCGTALARRASAPPLRVDPRVVPTAVVGRRYRRPFT